MPATKARDHFADTLNRVAYKGERIALERRGKTLAVLVSQEDLDTLEALENRRDVEAVRKARAHPDDRISYDEYIHKRLGK